MPRSREAVQVINHAGGGASAKLAAVVGVVVGAVAGAVGTRAAFDHRPGLSQQETASGAPGGEKDAIGPFDRDAAGVTKPGGVKDKLVRFVERHDWRWLGRLLQLQTRYSEIKGNNLAGAVTLQTFLALFPLLLVAAAVLGWVISSSDGDVTSRIIDATGLQGDARDTMRDALSTAAASKEATSIIGVLTLIWSALRVSAAIQYAYNQVWQTTGRGLKDRAVGAAWMGGAALLLVASAAATTVVNWLPAGAGVVGVITGIALTFALWMYTAKILPNIDIGWRALVPGAIVGVVGLEVLKFLGGVWVPKAVASSSELYGTIGVVLAVVAWLFLFGKLVVFTGVVNVVAYEAKHGVQTAEIQMPTPAAAQASTDDVTRSGRANS